MPTGPGPSCLLDLGVTPSPGTDGEGVDGRATREVECRDASLVGFVYVPGPESKSVPFLFINQHTFMSPCQCPPAEPRGHRLSPTLLVSWERWM